MNNKNTQRILLIILSVVLAVTVILYVIKRTFSIPVTLAILAGNIVVFIFVRTGKLSIEKLGTSYYDTIRGKQLYRVYTSAFTHREIWHLMMNMISLFNLGSVLEPFLGSIRFLILYAVITTIEGIVSCILHAKKSPSTLSIGASGVLFGLLGVYIVFVLTFQGISGIFSILPTLAIMVLMVFSRRIDSIAHFTGLGTGILCGIVLLILRLSKIFVLI